MDRLTERVWQASLDGVSQELGDVQDFGWYGLMKFRRATAILAEDSQGFRDVDLCSHDEAEQKWQEIEAEYQEFVEEQESDC